MIKVIIFDVDGVLVNAERFSDRLAREHSISSDQTAPFFLGSFQDCLVGTADLKEVIVPYLDEWGWTGGVDAFLDYWFASEHVVNKELVDMVQSIRARGLKCVVATNNEKHRTEYMLVEMGFSTNFDKVYASAHLGCRKPDTRFYATVLEDLGIDKEEALFVDDTMANVVAATEFGINAVLYTDFNGFKQAWQRFESAGL